MAKKEFTATQVMALQEETLKQFKIIAEQYGSVMDKLSEHDKRFEMIDKRFELIDLRLVNIDMRFKQIDKRFDRLEGKVDKYFHKNETEHLDFQHRLQAVELK